MIGVIRSRAENSAVEEFFQLFKTPWEHHRPGSEYDVLICSGEGSLESSASLILIYGSEKQPFDKKHGLDIVRHDSPRVLIWDGERIPTYGKCATFPQETTAALVDQVTHKPAALILPASGRTFVRIGFDLFEEIRSLLTRGQPSAHAAIPTLELHIAFLRSLITSYCDVLVEIPPVPVNYPFIVCLTHDVDHFSIRNHKWDHTAFGFIYRAVIGSLFDFCQRRKSAQQVVANWRAVLSLPLVYLGLARDFWDQFDRYLFLEQGLASTFFFIPMKGDSGQDEIGNRPRKRAAAYDLAKITNTVHRLLECKREIGLHGIDAWRDCKKGCLEQGHLKSATGASRVGVRMHWLFFDAQSPAILEETGFSYDSTVGYNDVVGYRAGTTQVFKFLEVARMLELPLHLMDTALFFPAHMNLSPKRAELVVDRLIDNVVRFGGVLTINWHDRSIAPERLWDETYLKLLDDLKEKGAWFPTAMQAVSWFQKRRSTTIESAIREGDTLRVKVAVAEGDANLPGLRLRVHRRCKAELNAAVRNKTARGYVDTSFSCSNELLVQL